MKTIFLTISIFLFAFLYDNFYLNFENFYRIFSNIVLTLFSVGFADEIYKKIELKIYMKKFNNEVGLYQKKWRLYGTKK